MSVLKIGQFQFSSQIFVPLVSLVSMLFAPLLRSEGVTLGWRCNLAGGGWRCSHAGGGWECNLAGGGWGLAMQVLV